MLNHILQLLKKSRTIFTQHRKTYLLLGLAAVALIGFFIFKSIAGKPAYILEAATYDSLTETVSESGTVTSTGTTPIYSPTNGVIDEIYVKNGDSVAEDDILFHVKSTATKQQKDTAASEYLAAKSELEEAKATQLSLQATMFGKWDTFRELAESDNYEREDGSPKYENRALPEFHIPEKEWLAAESDYKNQQLVISQKGAAANAAWLAYQATLDNDVEAVLGGVVQNVSVSKGDRVLVPTATTLASTTPILILTDESVKTLIKVEVNETDILKVREGQPVKITLDASPGKIFKGTVDKVNEIASPTDVVSFSVYITLTQNSNIVKRGMTADVDITVSEKGNVLVVPSSAVKPYQGGRAVRIVDNKGEIEYVPVKIGSRGDGVTEIVSGISEGTEVIVALPNEKIERKGGLF